MAADGKTPPTHPQGGAGTLCVHVVSLCADTKTMTCPPCWDTHILTYQQTDRQTHRHTYINQYKHIVIPIHGCICVTYPPFGGGGWGGTRGGWIIYIRPDNLYYCITPFLPCLSHCLCPTTTPTNDTQQTNPPPAPLLRSLLFTWAPIRKSPVETWKAMHQLIDVIVKRLDFLGETVDGRNPKQPPPGI